MGYHVLEEQHVVSHVVWLRFRGGTEAQVDLAAELVGPVFEPLLDVEEFARFSVHPEFHTLVRPNGAGIAPELLHRLARMAT